jgi:signal transduction histidine kinase
VSTKQSDSSPTKAQADADFQRQALETILRIDHIMSTITDLRQLLRLIMAEAEQLANGEASSVMLYDPEHNDLHFELVMTPDEKVREVIKQIRVPMGESSIAGYSATHREPLIVNDVYNDPRFFRQSDEKSSFKTRSIIAVPMLRKDRLIGVLEVLNKRGEGGFTDADRRMLEVLAHQAAIAIENAQLFEANLKAERLAAIGQAVAGLAHYVKNIVTGMKGSTTLVETAIQEKSYDMLPRAWEILRRSSDKVTTLVQDMLSYSKEREPELSPTNLNAVAEEVKSLYDERAKEGGAAIELELEENLPETPLDEIGIHRCLTNFVGNALDALASYERNSQEPPRVIVRTRFNRDENQLVLEVEDNGCGIAQEKIDKIWEPFVSDKGSRGTGLGLAVTKKIILEHGGKVTATSQVGEGTSFHIAFPVEFLEQKMERLRKKKAEEDEEDTEQ